MSHWLLPAVWTRPSPLASPADVCSCFQALLMQARAPLISCWVLCLITSAMSPPSPQWPTGPWPEHWFHCDPAVERQSRTVSASTSAQEPAVRAASLVLASYFYMHMLKNLPAGRICRNLRTPIGSLWLELAIAHINSLKMVAYVLNANMLKVCSLYF